MEKVQEINRFRLWQKCLKRISSWRKKGSRSTDGGALDWIDFSVFIGLSVFNSVQLFIDNKPISDGLYFVLPFIIIALLISFAPGKNHIKAFIFLICAIVLHIKAPYSTDFSSAIFFIFAFSEIKSIRAGIIIFVITLGTIVYKSSIVGQSNPQALNMAFLFVYLYTRSYFSFFSGSINKPIKTRISELTPEQRKIMTMAGKQGMPQKEIAHETGLSDDKVYSIIHEVRVLFGKDGKPAPLTKVIHELALPIEKSSRKTVSENR